MSETVSTSAPAASGAGPTSGSSQGSAPATGQSQSGAPQANTPAFNGGANSFEEPKTPAAGETAKPEAPQKRYLEADADEALVKVKIDGVEQELSVKELKRLTSLERASQKRLQDVAKERQRLMQERELAKQDPNRFMKEVLGRDPDSWAEELLARKYELSQMSPEQRENLELKSRLEAKERLELESKKSVIDEIKKLSDKVPEHLEKYSKEDLANYRDHLASVNQQAQVALEQEMITAWEETKLPKHKTWANWMAMEMMGHEKRTGEPLSAKEAAAKVKSDYQKFNRHLLTQMDAPAIHEWLGKEIVEKLMEHRIQSATSQAAQGFQKQSPAPAASDSKKPFMTELEYRQWLKS